MELYLRLENLAISLLKLKKKVLRRMNIAKNWKMNLNMKTGMLLIHFMEQAKKKVWLNLLRKQLEIYRVNTRKYIF